MASLPLYLGIYISCHGSLTGRYINAPNVKIIKKNLGGYGCPSYPVRHADTFNQVALTLTRGLIGCTPESYSRFFKPGQKDNYGDIIDTEGSCQLFNGNQEWLCKRYSFDATRKYLLFALDGSIINIVDCAHDELKSFLGISDASIDEMLLEFIEKRSSGITTEDIFRFVEILVATRGIERVNMLDESCNIVKADEKTTKVYKGVRSVTDYFPKPKDQVAKLKEGAGYGGKRTAFRKSKRRTKYVSRKIKKTKRSPLY